jgi:hypothetical protein
MAFPIRASRNSDWSQQRMQGPLCLNGGAAAERETTGAESNPGYERVPLNPLEFVGMSVEWAERDLIGFKKMRSRLQE